MRVRTAAVMVLGLALVVAGVAYYVSVSSTGTLAIRVRDVPITWSHVVITFSSVSVQPSSAPNDTGWVELTVQADSIDFLSLQNVTQLLTLDRLAPGAYGSVRLLIASVSGVLSSGTPVAMTVLDGIVQTPTSFTLRGGATTTLTFDLDLAESIQPAGSGWSFTPVLGPVQVS